MKYLLIISCLLFTSVGWSKDINGDDLIKRQGLYYEKFTEKPFTGNVTGKEQGKISKGKREGEWVHYYENGQLRGKSNYKEGKLEDEVVFKYYENGQLEETWTYTDYVNGYYKKVIETHFNKNGQAIKTVITKDDKFIETIIH